MRRNRSLDELGISLVNIRSTGFQNVAVLFHDDRIRKLGAIIPDLDSTFFDTMPNSLDTDAMRKANEKARKSQASGLSREATLGALCKDNQWLSAHFAPHALEVDFVAAENSAKIVAALNDVDKIYFKLQSSFHIIIYVLCSKKYIL